MNGWDFYGKTVKVDEIMEFLRRSNRILFFRIINVTIFYGVIKFEDFFTTNSSEREKLHKKHLKVHMR